jgi:hypothetical protein
MADERMVRVVNKTNTEVGIALNSGAGYINLTQFIKGKQTHISAPVAYSLLPDPVVKPGGMLARGEVGVVDA